MLLTAVVRVSVTETVCFFLPNPCAVNMMHILARKVFLMRIQLIIHSFFHSFISFISINKNSVDYNDVSVARVRITVDYSDTDFVH